VRLVALSDTHGGHAGLVVPDGDLLVHAGDATQHGRADELVPFLDWLSGQPHEHKVFVAGNHDRCTERDPEATAGLCAARGIVFLCDEARAVAGLSVFGSPITPFHLGMAWNRARGPVIAESWAKIPAGLDLLITHGPPHLVGDRVPRAGAVGCADLRARVAAVRPRVHVFGHVHEAHGAWTDGELPDTRFFNVAIGRRDLRPVTVVEL
jgi:Icc-related predicted phosphoesterase